MQISRRFSALLVALFVVCAVSQSTTPSTCNTLTCSSTADCDSGQCCGGKCVASNASSASGGACGGCTTCNSGLSCNATTLTCATPTCMTTQETCACTGAGQCNTGLSCINGNCLKTYLNLGDMCANSTQCPTGSSCNSSGICVAKPCDPSTNPATCYSTYSCPCYSSGWTCNGTISPLYAGQCNAPATPTLVADGSACNVANGMVCTGSSSCVGGTCVAAFSAAAGASCNMLSYTAPAFSVCMDDLVCYNATTTATTGACTKPTLCGPVGKKADPGPTCNADTSTCGCNSTNFVTCNIVYNPCNSARKALADCIVGAACGNLGGTYGISMATCLSYFGTASSCIWNNCQSQLTTYACCRNCGGSSLNVNSVPGLTCGTATNSFATPAAVCGGTCPTAVGTCPGGTTTAATTATSGSKTTTGASTSASTTSAASTSAASTSAASTSAASTTGAATTGAATTGASTTGEAQTGSTPVTPPSSTTGSGSSAISMIAFIVVAMLMMLL